MVTLINVASFLPFSNLNSNPSLFFGMVTCFELVNTVSSSLFLAITFTVSMFVQFLIVKLIISKFSGLSLRLNSTLYSPSVVSSVLPFMPFMFSILSISVGVWK